MKSHPTTSVLKAVLRPFAKEAERGKSADGIGPTPPETVLRPTLTFGELDAARQALAALEQGEGDPSGIECHKLDTPSQVFFYEQDFYVLSNFSSFAIVTGNGLFPTVEHAYHWLKFSHDADNDDVCRAIRRARSAHDAFRIGQDHKHRRRKNWDDVKVGFMRDLLREKVEQHEYVRRKLLATGDRELIEDSWRDDYWGWGPNRDGQNILGKLWMELRAELRAHLSESGHDGE